MRAGRSILYFENACLAENKRKEVLDKPAQLELRSKAAYQGYV
jgi:hypothetical protein